MARDYYDILGVSRTTDDAAIKKAYRRLAKKYHPDVNDSEEAKAKFAELQQAYDVLSDAKKRKLYDQYGHAGVNAGASSGAAGGAGGFNPFDGGQWHSTNTGPGGFSFRTGGGEGLGDIFEQFFGGPGSAGSTESSGPGDRGARGRRRGGFGGFGSSGGAVKGENVQHTITVPFDTAAKGGTVSLNLRAGRNGKAQTIDVKIPKATADGAKLRVKGKGQPSPMGGAAGDLILTVKVAAHPWFKREGLDLSVEIPISIDEAVFGGEIEVPTLNGKRAKLKVPTGTGGGKRLRLRGAGLENIKGDKGDLYAVLRIAVPEKLTDTQRDALESIKGKLPNPRQDVPW